jgi:hypothetical protein
MIECYIVGSVIVLWSIVFWLIHHGPELTAVIDPQEHVEIWKAIAFFGALAAMGTIELVKMMALQAGG